MRFHALVSSRAVECDYCMTLTQQHPALDHQLTVSLGCYRTYALPLRALVCHQRPVLNETVVSARERLSAW